MSSSPAAPPSCKSGDPAATVASITLGGTLGFSGTAALTVTGAFTNSATLDLDTGYGDGGGSLSIGGTLANNNGGTVQIGTGYLNAGAANTLTLYLNNYATENPATIAATGNVSNTGNAISAQSGHAWTISNYGTMIENIGSYDGARFRAGGYLANGASGSTSGLISGVKYGVVIGGTTATGAAAVIANFATIAGNVGVYIETSDTANNTITNAGSIVGTSGTALVFGGGNDLPVVEPGAAFSGAVANFHPGDTIDFVGVSADASGYANGVLTLDKGTAPVAQLALSFGGGAVGVRLTADGSGGTDVTALSEVVPADFDDDSRSEVLFQSNTGDTGYRTGDQNGNVTGFQNLGVPNPGYTFVWAGGFDNSGHAEVLWENTASGDTRFDAVEAFRAVGSAAPAGMPEFRGHH